MTDFSSTIEDNQEFIDACKQLMGTIKEKDRECQGFRVVVEAEENESESEAEVEDVSDDS